MKQNQNHSLARSFACAFRGIAHCIKHERNMKIHLAVTAVVIGFAVVFREAAELTRAELILLVLTCTLVMALEVVNTAIERLTDKASPEFSPLAKAAKDAAAGAVLLASIAAVIVAVILFGEPAAEIIKGVVFT